MFQIALISALFISPILPPGHILANRNTQKSQNLSALRAKNEVKKEFLSPSETLSAMQIQDIQERGMLDMNTTCKDEAEFFHFISSNDEIWFELSFVEELPAELMPYRTLFIRKEKWIKGVLKEVLAYSKREGVRGGNSTYIDQANSELLTASSPMYTLTTRRVLSDTSPQSITADALKELLKGKNILFYTGAGISVASGVPSMDELFPLLGIVEKDFTSFYKKILERPDRLIKDIRSFHQSCFFNSPTDAHFALKEIAELAKSKILTENLDSLHEQTGIAPYKVCSEDMRKKVDPVSFDQIDAIVCVGLSCDDKGFLGWYKEHHPNGKIIAIDYVQPEYLGDEDYWLNQDLQEVCSSLLDFYKS